LFAYSRHGDTSACANRRETISTRVTNCELYPFPIPDLFVGAPLVVAGRYTARSVFPSTIRLQGYQADGRVIVMDVPTNINREVPVAKLFLKQQLDLLTGRAWLENSEKLRQQVIELSCAQSMPSAHTTMVAYETNEKKKKKDDSKGKSASSANVAKVAAIAVGSAIAIGAAAVFFGSVAGTLNNVPAIGSGVISVFDSIGHASGICNCFSCCDCGLFSMIGDCFHHIFCGCGICHSLFDCCGNMVGCLGGICGLCGDCIGAICGGLGSICTNCGDCIGGVCHCFGQLGGELCKCLGEGLISGICEALFKC